MADSERWRLTGVRGESPNIRVLRLFALLAVVVSLGTLGYHFLSEWTWLESFNMTVITITTVGYGEVRSLEPEGQVFTILLVLASVGIVAYSATTMTSMVMETRVSALFWKRRMEKNIKKMRNHFIVCGYGRTGRAISRRLDRAGLSHVVVENKPEMIALLQSQERFVVDGDPS